MNMKGYNRLNGEMVAALVFGGLLAIPMFDLLPLVGIGAAVVTSAAFLSKLK
jgi:hypothetical protein